MYPEAKTGKRINVRNHINADGLRAREGFSRSWSVQVNPVQHLFDTAYQTVGFVLLMVYGPIVYASSNCSVQLDITSKRVPDSGAFAP
ncbi:hypothetical protein MKMG_01958 [Methanogenium sp. MK-MG]|nr:hypothetical protein MKMG_01958 [Methanogenium sp. MK-MG]